MFFSFEINDLIVVVQIVLCGGGTKIPKLRDAIQDKLPNADMLSSISGDEVIVLGAARQVNTSYYFLCFSNPIVLVLHRK